MSLPWLKALDEKNRVAVGTTVTVANKKRNKQYKDVIYPAFMACAELTQEESWRRVFEDLGHGVRFRGFNIRNKSLAYTNGNRTITIRMDLEPRVLMESIMDLVSTYRGLLKRDKDDDECMSPSEIPADWRMVKKKACRRNYILRFICKQARALNWSDDRTEEACSTMINWMEHGLIRMTAATMVEGEVTSIEGVTIDKEGLHLVEESVTTRSKPALMKIHISRLYCRTSQYTTKAKSVAEAVEDEETSTTA